MILGAIVFFILGAIIGSFLNVVILRYNTGRGVIYGRSACFSCNHVLEWYELIPIFSFLFLCGKCHKCKSRISWQYFSVELLTGLIFLCTFCKYFVFQETSVILANAGIQGFLTIFWIPVFTGITGFALTLIIFSILIVILTYDLKHKIIPDGLVYAFIILSFLRLILIHLNWAPAFLGMTNLPTFNFQLLTLNLLAGPLMFLPFFLLWFFSGGRWMGFGDAKLAWGIGWFLGLVGATSAVILSFWSGAVVGIVLLVIQRLGNWRLKDGRKKLTMKSEIPFAPFLILGLLLVYFFSFDVAGLHFLLSI